MVKKARLNVLFVAPIVTYASEVWARLIDHDFDKWDLTEIEKTHLQLCKRILVMNRSVRNTARTELGSFPLLVSI